MSKKVKKIMIILMMIIVTFSLGACGRHPMTTKEMEKYLDKFERGKISEKEYLEARTAYYNGEPAPKKGIIGFFSNLFGNIFGFIKEVIGLVFGLAVIAFIVKIFVKKE